MGEVWQADGKRREGESPGEGILKALIIKRAFVQTDQNKNLNQENLKNILLCILGLIFSQISSERDKQ